MEEVPKRSFALIRRQPDIAFRSFADITDNAEPHKKSVDRDREILKTLIEPSVGSSFTRLPRTGSSNTNANG
jgi:hypothetical protein